MECLPSASLDPARNPKSQTAREEESPISIQIPVNDRLLKILGPTLSLSTQIPAEVILPHFTVIVQSLAVLDELKLKCPKSLNTNLSPKRWN